MKKLFFVLLVLFGSSTYAAAAECVTTSQMVARNKSIVSRELRFDKVVQKSLVELMGMAGRADYIMFVFLKNGAYGYAAFDKGCFIPGSANVMDQKTFLAFMSMLGNPNPLPPDKEV